MPKNTMQTLEKIVHHGSRQGKETGWALWPGFTMAHFTDGTTKYFREGTSQDRIIAALNSDGIDTQAFIASCEKARKANSYPDKPEAVEGKYQHGYGYEVPIELGEWSWSTTFGRWGRIAKFSDGWHGYTFPKTF